jgi:hypothetical protein
VNDDDEAGWLVLRRCLWPLPETVVPGSTIIVANCGHRAWISPSGRWHRAGDGAGLYTVCATCCAGEVDGPDVDRREVPGSLAELEQTYGPAVADRARAFLKPAARPR